MTSYVVKRAYGVYATLFGVLGLIGTGFLHSEKIKLANDPAHVPTCSINAKLNCGPALNSWQSHVFGIWNTWIGFAGFSVVLLIGVWFLLGKSLPKSLSIVGLLGSTLAFIFTLWLAYQSFYNLGALCPWCFLVWVSTIGVLGTFLAVNLDKSVVKNWVAVMPIGLPILLVLVRLIEASIVLGADTFI